jgi:hypothetical protein
MCLDVKPSITRASPIGSLALLMQRRKPVRMQSEERQSRVRSARGHTARAET